MHHGPSVCCQEFEPKPEITNDVSLCEGFCVNCIHFEIVDGVPLCAKDHRPGVACGAFKKKEG
jgi:hypothetical protein